MSMTRSEVLRALADGKEVQTLGAIAWDAPECVPLDCPWCMDHWRIKPTPAKAPLGPKDIPSPCWVKCKDYPHPEGCGYLVVAVLGDSIFVAAEEVLNDSPTLHKYSYNVARNDLLYSPDRLTWKEMSK